MGDSVRQNPLNCNQPDPCTTFPPALDATINPGDAARERQSYEEKMAWFWLGFTLDPALVITEDSLATVSGDYFLALSQPWYQVHNAFVVATIVTAKANARDYLDRARAWPCPATAGGPARARSWRSSTASASCTTRRRNDLRYPIHERLWANAFRMFLLLMDDELARTGQVFDRARTLDGRQRTCTGGSGPVAHWSAAAARATTPTSTRWSPRSGRRLAAAIEVGVVQGY